MSKEAGRHLLAGASHIALTVGRSVADDCYCIRCSGERSSLLTEDERIAQMISGKSVIRFACEICGNKRCPHHSDHRLKCTNSNSPGQPGSIYKK